jgi:methionyl-tRNA formyltransferase
MKIIFFGSSEYCLPILSTLKANFDLITIITKSVTPIELFARKNGISVFTPKDKNELLALADKIVKLQPDIAVVADYGLIIPKVIFEIPKHQTLNIHFSKLPKLRGASPVQYTILAGETAWISVIIMDEGMDTGDIVWQKEMKQFSNFPMLQLKNETTGSLYKKLFQYIAYELPKIITDYIDGKLTLKKQDHSKATYTKQLSRDDGFIPPQILDTALNGNNISKDSISKYFSQKSVIFETLSHCDIVTFLDRAIRAFSPWPGVWTKIDIKGKRLKFIKAHIDNDRLILDLVQLEGKKPVSWKQFREGYPKVKLSNNS